MPNTITCETCYTQYDVSNNVVYRLKSSNKPYCCKKCGWKKAAKSRPQNSKEYWSNPEIQNKHSSAIKASQNYKKGIANRNNSGENNGMYGKKASEETRTKMKISRTGKKQSEETVNKRRETIKQRHEEKIHSGMKMIHSLNYELKRYINGVCKWSFRIFERDGWKCTSCTSTTNLDAHHIKPFSIIIKECLANANFKTDLEKYNYLKTKPELIDNELLNGITLCRECHKKIHLNWGSHNPKI
jgi:hypothetical protein